MSIESEDSDFVLRTVQKISCRAKNLFPRFHFQSFSALLILFILFIY